MSPLPRMKPIVPWWQIAGLLVLCAVGIYFLLPDDPKLLENLIRDRNLREARRLLDRISPEHRARDPVRYHVLELRLARLELPPGDPAAVQRFWQHAVASWSASGFADAVFLEFTHLVPQLRDPAAAWLALRPHFSRAPEKQRLALGDRLAAAALAAAQPAVAAEIYAATHPAPTRSPAASLELARLWQLAGRPADALAALGESDSPEIATRRLTLLRELNRNREALDLLRPRLAAQPVPDRDLLEDFAQVALQAGAAAEAIPPLERFLAAHPDDLDGHRRVRALLIATGQPAAAIPFAQRAVVLSRRDADDVRALARVLEWAGQPGPAFDAWLELSLQGDLSALDRLVALNPGLFRDADLMKALQHAAPVPGHDEYTLQLARLQTSLGYYDEARATYERYLRAQPADFAALVERARLDRELYHFAAAEARFRQAAALRPDDLELQREIAECLVFQNKHEQALAAYIALSARSTADNILGPLTRLAESLGRYDAFAAALRRRIDTSDAPHARDFLVLAYAHELRNDPTRRRAVLEEGLRKIPDNDDLRFQLALLLAGERDFRRAQQILAAHRQLRADPPVTALYLELLRANADTAAERAFLAQPLPPALLQDENVIERLALAYEAQRNHAAAEPLFRSLHQRYPTDVARAADLARVLQQLGRLDEARRLIDPFLREPTPTALRVAADLAEAAGDHRAAERHQLAYLAAVASAPATDWGALGDIRLARGDRAGARQAYTEALRRLHAEIARRTTVQ